MSEHTAEFHEAHQRLGAMHGYLAPGEERLARVEAKLDALETLVRELKHALSAGAVGKWT